jgi:Golgi casein kinase, C-terminal, Fam20
MLLELATSPPGNRLGDRLRQSMGADNSNPKVGEAHLTALNRRVGIVLDQINLCHHMQQQQQQEKQHMVVVDDGMSISTS